VVAEKSATKGDQERTIDFSPGGPLDQLRVRAPPVYEITIRLVPPRISVGWRTNGKRKVVLWIRLSGFGEFGMTKLWVDTPEGLLDTSNPGTTYTTIAAKKLDHRRVLIDSGQREGEQTIQSGGFTLHTLPAWDMPVKAPRDDRDLPNVLGEMIGRSGLPAHVAEFNLAKDAKPGDHPITAVLTYASGDHWVTSRTDAVLHVNDWHERWGQYVDPLTFVMGAVVGTAFSLITVLYH
jgi:hypothetical protein